MILRWLEERHRKRAALKAAVDEWLKRHGPYARTLASERSMDAYLLGDLDEQRVWSEVREKIDEEKPGKTRDGEFPV